jgi:membrane protease YdiL (CAAX protease family)
VDRRVALALLYTAIILTVMEYWCLPIRFEERSLHHTQTLLRGISEISLNSGALWAASCILGFLIGPLLITVFVHREGPTSIGMSARGFHRHGVIYLGLYLLMLPLIVHVSQRPDFQGTYPFVASAAKDLSTFVKWEATYLAQFFALEAFFRGYLLFTLEKSMGWNAIFVMTVPYGMIHWHKPPAEAFGAVFAGVILGALALRFRSFYGGALLHAMVAFTMDFLAAQRGGAFS